MVQRADSGEMPLEPKLLAGLELIAHLPPAAPEFFKVAAGLQVLAFGKVIEINIRSHAEQSGLPIYRLETRQGFQSQTLRQNSHWQLVVTVSKSFGDRLVEGFIRAMNFGYGSKALGFLLQSILGRSGNESFQFVLRHIAQRCCTTTEASLRQVIPRAWSLVVEV